MSRATRVAPESKVMPAASYSDLRCPAPSPSSKRPSARVATPAASRAVSTGWRKSLLSTNVPVCSRCVAIAAAVAPANGETEGTRWSGKASTSNPAASTACAKARIWVPARGNGAANPKRSRRVW
ncbi:Uncharacterised protein [Mycobacterium tuberculosis]|uniref:Uncharacterized protein n=1 Tax=Mycobacterium tuberculosis TaxID=1773 RepID=A0A0U0STJ6_MYCTX|nr:Uncharacterised protein [Mycobacterium tuberculosis]COX76700.1 Uncharacterised protein [Mycobacterium tuberculosis]